MTLNTVNSVGNLYKHQNKLVEAEKMYERALRGYEKTLGLEHISALGTVHNLGVLYKLRASWLRQSKCTSEHCEGTRRH